MRSPELVEQCLMCDLGSTTGYDSQGDPVLGEQHLPVHQLAEIARVQQGLLDFVRRFAASPSIAATGSLALRPFLEAILVRSLTEPVKAELDGLRILGARRKHGFRRTRALIAADLEPEYLEYASAHQLASLESSSVYWIFGLAHRINPVIGDAVRSIFLRKARPKRSSVPRTPGASSSSGTTARRIARIRATCFRAAAPAGRDSQCSSATPIFSRWASPSANRAISSPSERSSFA
jgi:hypothetical protein